MNIQEEIKALKRPYHINDNYVIKAELEDIANLIAIKETERAISEFKTIIGYTYYDEGDLYEFECKYLHNTLNKRIADLEQQLLKLREGNK
jgi:hypothetical protein